jgi:hypothetical protein
MRGERNGPHVSNGAALLFVTPLQTTPGLFMHQPTGSPLTHSLPWS